MRRWESPVESGVRTFGLPSSIRAEILPGLPPYADPDCRDVSFRGARLIRPNLVVGFTPSVGAPWIGNFEWPGETTPASVTGVFHTFDVARLLVVARGRGYLVREDGSVEPPGAEPIVDVFVDDGSASFFVVDFERITCYDPDLSVRWRSEVIADPLVEAIEEDRLRGHAEAGDRSFQLDLHTGRIM